MTSDWAPYRSELGCTHMHPSRPGLPRVAASEPLGQSSLSCVWRCKPWSWLWHTQGRSAKPHSDHVAIGIHMANPSTDTCSATQHAPRSMSQSHCTNRGNHWGQEDSSRIVMAREERAAQRCQTESLLMVGPTLACSNLNPHPSSN